MRGLPVLSIKHSFFEKESFSIIDQTMHAWYLFIIHRGLNIRNMDNAKNIHSGKTAEKKRANAIKRDLLILIHDFLTQEGLFEAAESMATQLGNVKQPLKNR